MHFDPHAMLPVAYRAARKVARSDLLAHEASERAVHQLSLAVIDGALPQRPKAWLRVVARRSACALMRSEWGRMAHVDPDAVVNPPPRANLRAAQAAWVRETLEAKLTPRQRDVLDAAMSCNTTRAAARTCGMEPRDFRRSITSISRRGRELLARDPDASMRLADRSLDRDLPGCEHGRAV